MNEQHPLTTIDHQVNITVDNASLLRIALTQLGLLLVGFILKVAFERIK